MIDGYNIIMSIFNSLSEARIHFLMFCHESSDRKTLAVLYTSSRYLHCWTIVSQETTVLAKVPYYRFVC